MHNESAPLMEHLNGKSVTPQLELDKQGFIFKVAKKLKRSHRMSNSN